MKLPEMAKLLRIKTFVVREKNNFYRKFFTVACLYNFIDDRQGRYRVALNNFWQNIAAE